MYGIVGVGPILALDSPVSPIECTSEHAWAPGKCLALNSIEGTNSILIAHVLMHGNERLQVGAVAVLGVTVVTSFAVMWGPWLTSVDSVLQVRFR